MFTDEQVIGQTKKWINDVVIGCNFCPFASKVVKQQTVFYAVVRSLETAVCLEILLQECARLDADDAIETTFLIFPENFNRFQDYLFFVSMAEKLLKQSGYNGIYQLASFHPLYRFANSPADDAANYTNRSIYPMLHLLRESSIDQALEYYNNPESIPENNIQFAREKGIVYMKMLRDQCMHISSGQQ